MNFLRSSNFDHKPVDCGICIDTFNEHINDCLKLRCGHIFHRACVEQWVSEKQSCPLCRRISVLSIPEPIKNVLNKARGSFVQAFSVLACFGGILAGSLLPIVILKGAYRVHQGLPFFQTTEEILKMNEEAYQHNLKLGFDYKPRNVGLGELFSYSLVIIPCVLAGGIALCISTRLYLRNRIIMDVNSAIPMNYTPPPTVADGRANS